MKVCQYVDKLTWKKLKSIYKVKHFPEKQEKRTKMAKVAYLSLNFFKELLWKFLHSSEKSTSMFSKIAEHSVMLTSLSKQAIQALIVENIFQIFNFNAAWQANVAAVQRICCSRLNLPESWRITINYLASPNRIVSLCLRVVNRCSVDNFLRAENGGTESLVCIH